MRDVYKALVLKRPKRMRKSARTLFYGGEEHQGKFYLGGTIWYPLYDTIALGWPDHGFSCFETRYNCEKYVKFLKKTQDVRDYKFVILHMLVQPGVGVFHMKVDIREKKPLEYLVAQKLSKL